MATSDRWLRLVCHVLHPVTGMAGRCLLESQPLSPGARDLLHDLGRVRGDAENVLEGKES